MIPFWRKIILSLFRVRVRYTRNVTRALDREPAILTCNHLSMLDGVLVALASPRPLVFAVNVYHARENRVTSRILAGLSRLGLGEVVPLDTFRPTAARRLLRALQEGQSVMIFPEGQISQDGRRQPPMPGVEWLSRKSSAPVLSLRLRGADRSRWFGKAGSDLWPRIWLRF